MSRGVVFVLFCCVAFSCHKTSPPAVVPITPLQTLVNSDTTLSLFHRMLLQANETGLLADKSITLLIPTNAALRQAGYTETIIDSTGASVIDRMLRFQYITAAGSPDSGGYTAFPTLLGFAIHGMRDSARHIFFNGVMTAGDATPVGKALVFRLNGAISAARDSTVDLFGLDSSLSMLAEVFRRTNLYDSLLVSGNYTLLAPVNSAFRQAGYDSVGAIDSADIGSLLQLAQNQVIKGLFFTNTFPHPGVLTTLGGVMVAVSSSGGGFLFAGPGNTVPVNWLGGDQQAGATLAVHRVDQLISP
jgi:Fasciclin domain